MISPRMNHGDIQLLLADYRDLRGAERREVEAHVATCAACAARLAEYQAMDVELQGLRDARPTPALRAGYNAAIQGNNPPERRAQTQNRGLVYAFASVATILLVAVAAWTLFRPTNGGTLGRPWSIGAPTPAPTAEPVAMPTAAATTDPRLVIWPDWGEFEQMLSRQVLGATVANRVCDWIVLGRDGNRFYVWTYCAAYLNAPDITAASLPAVMTVTDGGASVEIQTPRDGTYYAEDVAALFPPAVQQMIFDRSFDSVLPQLERHAKLRLKWTYLPPLGAQELTYFDPAAPATSGVVLIFSGRSDPVWTLTHAELDELNHLVTTLTPGQCPALPGNLGYRGVAVGLGPEEAGRLFAAEGFVQSGDAGASSDAICLSDPERIVERFLLSSAQANVSDDLQPVLAGLLQPVPTPLVTPSPAPTVQPDWVDYADGKLDIVLRHPDRWEVGTQTDRSRVFQTRTDAPGENPVEPPPFWFTVLPPGFKNEDASAYNWWSDEELAAAWHTAAGETFTSVHAPAGYNQYTRLPDMTVDGFPAAVLNNPTMWEAPQGVQERRVLVQIGGLTVMFGTYYTTEEQLQTFEQVLASVKFGSLLMARGTAPSATPTSR